MHAEPYDETNHYLFTALFPQQHWRADLCGIKDFSELVITTNAAPVQNLVSSKWTDMIEMPTF